MGDKKCKKCADVKKDKKIKSVPKREQAATPSCTRGKICQKTGRPGCKCHRSQGTGGGCLR